MSDVLRGTVATTGKIKGSVAVGTGKDGASAYEVAVKNGFEGTEEEWVESLKGEKGERGEQGEKGDKGDKGDAGPTGQNGVSITKTEINSNGELIITLSDNSVYNLGIVVGAKGEDGTSITVSSITESEVDGGSNVVTFSDGKTITIKNGTKGSKGDTGSTGANGVGISSVEQTTTSTADDGNNIVTVTLTNGTVTTFTVQNGSKGSTGSKGADGYTPKKGVDYFTAEDKTEIINSVLGNFVDVSEVGQ